LKPESHFRAAAFSIVAVASIPTQPYADQVARWPTSGQHILAHYDETSIIVYQAYRPSIGRYAIEHQQLGGPDFSLDRMSWIKPNFLWMMHRSGWGTKEGQEITLGLRISIAFFETLLEQAVPSTYDASMFRSDAEWKDALAASAVRSQWDPDHAPSGASLKRRALQLGLRGTALEAFAQQELLEVIDLTAFVKAQRPNAIGGSSTQLLSPAERVYVPRSVNARLRVRLTVVDALSRATGNVYDPDPSDDPDWLSSTP
jgi:hypothetical protein